jgi:aminomethyltransferase
MSGLEPVHDEHGAIYTKLGDRRVVVHYGRPERTHSAVRNGVGVIDHPFGVVTVEGEDRHEFVDNAVSNAVPTADGRGVYALLLDPQGRIRTDMYVLTAADRLLILTPPGEATPLAEAWRETTFIQDVDVATVTDELTVFGVHGPQATEKIASVTPTQTPEDPLTFVRGSMGDAGVTVVRDDGLAGEEGYLVVSGTDAARDVFDSLENRGLNAVPFGWRTWQTLSLEAGTPLFETELADRIPNQLGLRNAVDFEKGCFVGQEVVSRIENRGQPNQRLVGLLPERHPESGAAVFDGDGAVGDVTRAVESPALDRPIAFALLDAEAGPSVTVRIDSEPVAAEVRELPFVDGSARSARLPSY